MQNHACKIGEPSWEIARKGRNIKLTKTQKLRYGKEAQHTRACAIASSLLDSLNIL